ncbi:translation initiation factor IF-2-like [Panthera pardus]|uniref:Translation initiation factor IF-2-like n=1 Tax=Panthera pardus TaxID=9691 RepID=A0A9W2VHN6_PANPR|nr:translation initiation factor IF-2-like [Panthera pardus]
MLHLPGAAGETGRWCALGGLERPRDPTSAGEQRRPSPSLRHGGFRQPDSGKTRARRAGGRYRPHTVHGLGLDQKDLGPPRAAPGTTETPAENQHPPNTATTRARGTQCGAGRNPGGSAQRRATPRRPAGRRRGTHPRGAAPRATRPRREPPRQGKGGRDRRRGAGAGPRLRPPTARPRTGRGGGHGRTAAVAARGKAARTTALRIRASTPHDGPRDRAARGTAKPSRDPGGDPKDRVRHEGSPPEGPRRRPRPSATGGRGRAGVRTPPQPPAPPTGGKEEHGARRQNEKSGPTHQECPSLV